MLSQIISCGDFACRQRICLPDLSDRQTTRIFLQLFGSILPPVDCVAVQPIHHFFLIFTQRPLVMSARL